MLPPLLDHRARLPSRTQLTLTLLALAAILLALAVSGCGSVRNAAQHMDAASGHVEGTARHVEEASGAASSWFTETLLPALTTALGFGLAWLRSAWREKRTRAVAQHLFDNWTGDECDLAAVWASLHGAKPPPRWVRHRSRSTRPPEM